jgi:hypothetical protein
MNRTLILRDNRPQRIQELQTEKRTATKARQIEIEREIQFLQAATEEENMWKAIQLIKVTEEKGHSSSCV